MKKIPILPAALFLAMQVCAAQTSIEIHFQADASNVPKPVQFGIRGSIPPLSWEKTYLLEDPDKDGIYEGKIAFDAADAALLEYKFVYGEKKIVYELEGENRILVLKKSQAVENQWNQRSAADLSALPPLSSQQLLADINILEKALLSIHPGLYRYNTPEQTDSIFRHFRQVFSQPMSYREAFLEMTRLTASIRCGHTYPNFFNQQGFIQQVVLNQADKLPFAFRVVEKRMIVTANASGQTQLDRGTEVTAINGIPVNRIFDGLSRLVKADGSNDTKRYADLNTFGSGSFEMFDAYFPLLYPPQNGKYLLEIADPKADKTTSLEVEPLSRAEKAERLKKNNPGYPVKADELWKLEFWEDNTAYLQLGTFDVFQLSFEWSDFLKKAFDEINRKKSPNLVLDIRWNEGGQDEVLLLLGQYLAKQPISPVSREDLVRYRAVPTDLKDYLFTWDASYYDLGEKVAAAEDGFYAFRQQEDLIVKPAKNAFKGDVFLLVNAANSSATFYFAELARANRIATLVGEPTGGSQKGLNGGAMFFLRLPNSKIEIDIPIIGTFSTEKEDKGITPDHLVAETAEDIINGTDPVILFTKALIKEK
ncbi:MAG: S41 family peptidase [Saprospiraceae bacterium]